MYFNFIYLYIFLFIYLAPSIIRDVSITQKSSRYLKIKWKSPLQPNGVVTHYEITITGRVNRSLLIPTIVPMIELTTTIDNLTPYTPYSLTIRAGTHFGGNMMWGEYSEVIHFVTEKEGKLKI